jgi:hypothetical protein
MKRIFFILTCFSFWLNGSWNFHSSFPNFQILDSYGLEVDFFKWTERADNVMVKGTVLAHEYYMGDQDWILEIKPDPYYKASLSNRKGKINLHKMMEAEIEPIESMGSRANEKKFFEPLVGKTCWVVGTWVDDNGHDSKTELHPMTGIVCVDKDTLKVFAFSDDSWNFFNKVPHSGENRNFHVSLPLESPHQTLLLLEETNKAAKREISLKSNELFISIKTGEPVRNEGFYYGKWLLI